jgi:membrane protein implicated in regulation of membrane protease activity
VWFKHRAWVPVAWLLSLGNLVAVWFAAQPAEPWHATTHALLAVLFALGARRLMARQLPPIDESRFDQLQHGIDVIALEVERISEGQRYVTKILNETLQPSIGAGEAQPITVNRKDVAPTRSRDEEPS